MSNLICFVERQTIQSMRKVSFSSDGQSDMSQPVTTQTTSTIRRVTYTGQVLPPAHNQTYTSTARMSTGQSEGPRYGYHQSLRKVSFSSEGQSDISEPSIAYEGYTGRGAISSHPVSSSSRTVVRRKVYTDESPGAQHKTYRTITYTGDEDLSEEIRRLIETAGN